MSEYNSLNPLNYALSDKVLDNLEATILGECNLGDCFLCRGLEEEESDDYVGIITNRTIYQVKGIDTDYCSVKVLCNSVGFAMSPETLVFKIDLSAALS